MGYKSVAVTFILCLLAGVRAVSVPPSGCVKKHPLPEGRPCGDRVNMKARRQVDPIVVKNINVCRDLLWARHQTATQPFLNNFFLFNTRNNTCELYFLFRSYDNYSPNPKSDTVLYDVLCFDCPEICPQEVGVDIVENGGFERSNKFIGPWGLIEDNIISKGNDSKNALSLYCKSRDGGCAGTFQDLNVCKGTAYFLQFIYRYANAKGTNYRRFYFGTTDYWLTDEPTTPKNVWLREGHSMDPFSQSDTHTIEFFSNSQGQSGNHFDIDSVQLVPLPEIFPTLPGARSVLVNGGFENGLIFPWVISSNADSYNASVESPGINSSRGLYFRVKHRNDDLFFIQIKQTVITVPRRQYVLTFNLEYLTQGDFYWMGFAEYMLEKRDPDFELFISGSLHQAIFTAPTNVTNLNIHLIFSGNGDAEGKFLFDNFALTEFVGIEALKRR